MSASSVTKCGGPFQTPNHLLWREIRFSPHIRIFDLTPDGFRPIRLVTNIFKAFFQIMYLSLGVPPGKFRVVVKPFMDMVTGNTPTSVKTLIKISQILIINRERLNFLTDNFSL